MDKSPLGDKDALDNICPALNVFQVKELIDHFIPDQLSPTPVPVKVKEKLEELCTKQKREGKNLPKELDVNMIQPLSLSYLTSTTPSFKKAV